MKKIPYLLLVIIFLATACNKEKNEPEPTTPIADSLDYFSDKMIGKFNYNRMVTRDVLYAVPKGHLGNYYDSVYDHFINDNQIDSVTTYSFSSAQIAALNLDTALFCSINDSWGGTHNVYDYPAPYASGVLNTKVASVSGKSTIVYSPDSLQIKKISKFKLEVTVYHNSASYIYDYYLDTVCNIVNNKITYSLHANNFGACAYSLERPTRYNDIPSNISFDVVSNEIIYSSYTYKFVGPTVQINGNTREEHIGEKYELLDVFYDM